MKFKLEAPGGLIDIRARCENGRGMVRIKLFSSKVQRLFYYYYFNLYHFYHIKSYRGDHVFDAELCWLVGTFASLAH